MEQYLPKLAEFKKTIGEISSPSTKTRTHVVGILDRMINICNKIYGNPNDYSTRIELLKPDKDQFERLLPIQRIREIQNIIDLIADDIELQDRKETVVKNSAREHEAKETIHAIAPGINNKIFIVHGHNEAMKQSVARIIEKLHLTPIILHEQASQGQTIIEKFLLNSSVGFAIICLSGDDKGYSIQDGPAAEKLRARQNVIFELGFFTAKLGRKRVLALVEKANNFEVPSDIHGVIYINYDSADGKWKFDVAKELAESGYEININKIL